MVSVPKVSPGDMVFWHCDVVHSVEQEHTGKEDSAGSFQFIYCLQKSRALSTNDNEPRPAVMYIPAVPVTPQNLEYVKRQKDTFLKGVTAPDFPKTAGEGTFVGVGKEGDIVGETARRAMGLAY